MWLKRLLVSVIAIAICAATSLSVAPGPAGAQSLMPRILAAADDLAPLVTRFSGSSTSLIKSRFVLQATKTTPVTDEASLLRLRDEWVNFRPRTPRQGEVTARPRELPSAYEKAGQILCQTAAELVDLPDKFSWQSTIAWMNDKIMEQTPIGRNLALHKDLNEIADKFRSGCYCAGTAQLAVLIATEVYC